MLERSCTEATKLHTLGHSSPVPYSSFSVGASPDLCSALILELRWPILCGQRVFSRLRAGLLELGHRQGHRTRAKVQTCIACFELVRRPGVHCIVECRCFQLFHAPLLEFFSEGPWSRASLCSALLGLRPGHPAYEHIVRLAVEIDSLEKKFWSVA